MTDRRPQTETDLIEHIRAIEEPAPPELHARVAALIDESTRSQRSPSRVMPVIGARWAAAGSLVATAVTIVVLILVLGGGSSSAGQLQTAAALTLRPATMSAPAESPRGATLDAQVDGVSFPYWEESFGWKASGSRMDRIGGRLIRTVFYSDAQGRRIGYAIVGGTPAARISGGTLVTRHGTPFRLLDIHGTEVVAWLRSGRLCVVSGQGIDGSTLVRLASWRARPQAHPGSGTAA